MCLKFGVHHNLQKVKYDTNQYADNLEIQELANHFNRRICILEDNPSGSSIKQRKLISPRKRSDEAPGVIFVYYTGAYHQHYHYLAPKEGADPEVILRMFQLGNRSKPEISSEVGVAQQFKNKETIKKIDEISMTKEEDLSTQTTHQSTNNPSSITRQGTPGAIPPPPPPPPPVRIKPNENLLRSTVSRVQTSSVSSTPAISLGLLGEIELKRQQLKSSQERLSNEQKKPLDEQEIFLQELKKKMISRNKFVSGHHEEDSEDDSTIITSIPKPKAVSSTEPQSQPVVEEALSQAAEAEAARQAAEETASQQAEETASQEQQRLLNDSLEEFYSQEVSNNLAESQYTLTELARESQQRQQEQRRSLLMLSTQTLPNPTGLVLPSFSNTSTSTRVTINNPGNFGGSIPCRFRPIEKVISAAEEQRIFQAQFTSWYEAYRCGTTDAGKNRALQGIARLLNEILARPDISTPQVENIIKPTVVEAVRTNNISFQRGLLAHSDVNSREILTRVISECRTEIRSKNRYT